MSRRRSRLARKVPSLAVDTWTLPRAASADEPVPRSAVTEAALRAWKNMELRKSWEVRNISSAPSLSVVVYIPTCASRLWFVFS